MSYRKLFVFSFLSTVVCLSFFASSSIFQKHSQLAYSQHEHDLQSNDSRYTSKNDMSNTLLEQFRKIVLDQGLSKDDSKKNSSIFGSNIAVPIVVGIITPNGTQVSGYGNISNFNPTRVDGNTVFDIASISKTFVAVILADMVNQGLVNLNDTIEMYLPVDSVTVPSFDGHKITLESLATHTSGLPDFPVGWIRNHSYTPQQVYDFISNTNLTGIPGTKSSYSDIGMGLLGHILSLKSGVSFDQLVRDRILNVLGMDSTGMRIKSSEISVPDDIKSRFAQGHIAGKVVNLEFIPDTIQSAGAMYSTANDL
ncbi:MAG TPA: serine hydrolase domain-containing protein, partial [Candidatus Nitrosocosmicus sp.]|nr:serine hydrolase domain-containing protein [Candidatus Nitrosocosmicus sp.]